MSTDKRDRQERRTDDSLDDVLDAVREHDSQNALATWDGPHGALARALQALANDERPARGDLEMIGWYGLRDLGTQHGRRTGEEQ